MSLGTHSPAGQQPDKAEETRPATQHSSVDHAWVIDHHQVNLIRLVDKNEPKSWISKALQYQSDQENDTEQGYHRHSTRRTMEISFAEMQRMRVRQLQSKLITHAAEMHLHLEEPEKWGEDLKDYVQALRDYEYMSRPISSQFQDPFIASSEDSMVQWVLQQIYKNERRRWPSAPGAISKGIWRSICRYPIHASNMKLGRESDGTDNLEVAPVGGTRTQNARKSALRSLRGRLGTAAFGAFFLVAPMWLLVLKKNKWVALISSTLFMLIFGCIMAVTLDETADVLSATAAYAAVLMVFVGAITFGN